MLDYLQHYNFILFDLIQFFYFISWDYLLIITIITINLFMFLNATTLIPKLTWFFFTLIGCASISWMCSLEIIGFILILTELALIFLFLIVATQFSLKIINSPIKINVFFVILMLLLCLLDFNIFTPTNSISYYNAIFLVITADYFFLYYFLVIYLDIVVYIALILGLFSLYFIFLYYKLKQLQNKTNKKLKTIYLVKKQNLLHQSIYQNYLRWFQ